MNVHQITTSIKEETNAQLVSLIKGLQKLSRTEISGAWASEKKLFLSDHPAIKALVEELGKHLEEVTALPPTELTMVGWGVILADENELHRHNHEFAVSNVTPPIRNDWAGIYYAQSPGGTIVFADGESEKKIICKNKAGNVIATYPKGQAEEVIETKAGLLLIFPADQDHYVTPHRKPERERISVAFNVRKAPKDEVM